MKMMKLSSSLLIATCLLALTSFQLSSAGHGCPLDNNQCQEYCENQGCKLGYCGHFAWIQCICRKCGEEWNYYDKVRYNPNKQVNQTELDSLKLNRTQPLILTNSEQEQVEKRDLKQVAEERKQEKTEATLTTLLIPDLSDNSKLDLNDIPDENSEKFLDFLARNHEKLVESSRGQSQSVAVDLSSEELLAAKQQAASATTVAPNNNNNDEQPEEMVEIQITSSNNNGSSSGSKRDGEKDDETDGASPVTRLLRMAVAERSSDEIERRR